LTNIIVLIIPFIIIFTGYASTYDIVEKEINISSQTLLQNTGSIVDKTIEEIENITLRLAFDSQIQRFVNMKPLSTASSDLIAVRNAWAKLSDYKIKTTNDYIIDLTISSNISGITISTSIPYSKYPFYYDTMFSYGDLNYSQWRNLFMNTYHSNDFLSANTVEIMEQEYNAIAYLQSIPIGLGNNPKGIIFALINVDQLNKLLAPIKYSPESTVLVFDGNDQLLLNNNPQSNINMDAIRDAIENNKEHQQLTMNKEAYTLTYYKSPMSKWTYVSIHPEKVITQKLIVWKRTIIILICCSLLVGILLVFYLSWRNANPIDEIYQTVAGDCPKPSGSIRQSYDYLKGSIDFLVKDQIRLKDEMDQQLKLLKYSYLKQLLSNGFLNESERKIYAQKASINMDFSVYLCAIVTSINNTDITNNSNESKSTDVAMERVQDFILSICDDSFFLDISTGQFVWIYCSNILNEAELYKDFTTTVCTLLDNLKIKYGISLNVDIGIPVYAQADCFQSFQSALSVYEYRIEHNGNNNLLWYTDIVKQQESFRFPVETELKLVNQIKEGMTSNVIREVEHLIAENLNHRTLSTERYHQFINTLLFILTRLNENLEKNMQIIIPPFNHLIRMKKNIVGEQIIRLFTSIAHQYETAIHNQQTKLKDQIENYINNHYDDANLTIFNIAEEFNMSENSIHSFFKKYLNTTFPRYLENLRIRKACRLLMDEVNVNTIATQVGYISPHTFRRAFKRIKGVTPTLYKNIMNDSLISDSW
jgi:AraC-like DNA-binding protein